MDNNEEVFIDFDVMDELCVSEYEKALLMYNEIVPIRIAFIGFYNQMINAEYEDVAKYYQLTKASAERGKEALKEFKEQVKKVRKNMNTILMLIDSEIKNWEDALNNAESEEDKAESKEMLDAFVEGKTLYLENLNSLNTKVDVFSDSTFEFEVPEEIDEDFFDQLGDDE